MVVRTHIYPFEIALPEVIEDIESAPKEYLELLEEVTAHGKTIAGRPAFKEGSWDSYLCCPICGFDYLHVALVAIVTRSSCIVTTRNGTKIIRSEGLGKRTGWRGWRLVMFCKCEEGHTTKIIFQYHKGNMHCLYDEIDEQKYRTITKTEFFGDIDGW